jgi:chorismate lyase/3-hydroxybenzoate synthase
MGLVSFGTVANFDSNSPSLCVPLLSIGRQGAFDQNQIGSENEFPATTVSGTQSGDITLYYLAARSAGQAFENPRRISAYRYPEQYGPASPAFSHSMLKRWCDVTHLYISGTASIVVHASRHQLPNEQLDDIVCNLRALVIHASAESGIDFCLEPHVPLKVYVRDIHDVPALRAPLQATLPTAPTLFFVSDICRRALGIEIEAFILSSPHV